MSRSKIFHLYGDITIISEGLQNLGLYAWCSGPVSREGSLSCHTCCDTGPRFFWSHGRASDTINQALIGRSALIEAVMIYQALIGRSALIEAVMS
jgi:hypothetical protein